MDRPPCCRPAASFQIRLTSWPHKSKAMADKNIQKKTIGPNEFTDFENVKPAVNRQPGYRRVDS